MKESLLSQIVICPTCKQATIPKNGEVCACEEPVVSNWEDANKQLLSTWQNGETVL